MLGLDFRIVLDALNDFLSFLRNGRQFTLLGSPQAVLQFRVHGSHSLVCGVNTKALCSSPRGVDLIPEMWDQRNRNFAVTCEAVKERVAFGMYVVEGKCHLMI